MRLGHKQGEQVSFACDTLVPDANASRLRSVEIAAPPKLVFRWLGRIPARWSDRHILERQLRT
jgi:hypothetical protein